MDTNNQAPKHHIFTRKKPHQPHSNGGPLLRIEHVSKAFGEKVILKDLSLHVDEGETLTVLGKSGTGKSVLLKLIVGLLLPDSGELWFKDEELTHLSELDLNAVRSNIGFLFQGGALFDSMTVGENLDFYLEKHTNLAPSDREKKVIRALDMVELPDVIDRLPSELSGGMKKRAGLARSIVLEPELMLYDEPTTGLDPVTASSIAELILHLQVQLGIASIVVTHDLPTAYTVTDRAVILNDGDKIFEGQLADLSKSDDPFLRKYLESSTLTHERRDLIRESERAIKQKAEAANARENNGANGNENKVATSREAKEILTQTKITV